MTADKEDWMDSESILIRNAQAHNLKHLDLQVPRGKLVVITGVSGSGKSSLAFDTLYREGARRYLETFSAFSRQHLARLERPPVDAIHGLPPVIAVSQLAQGASARSTVGTLADLHDLLRLLYARAGTLTCSQCQSTTLPPHPDLCPTCTAPLVAVSRSLFSFNSPRGACPACQGRGTEDAVAPELLVADANKTLREGAMVPTLKRGYIVYSQVTMEVLDDVCNAHGFSVDTPWKDLTQEQQDVIFYGSTRLKVPFGKHTLESRLKWTGLTAKPREEGHYRGLIPVIAETLKRNRNDNVLRFVRTRPCSACGGGRLHPSALLVRCGSHDLASLSRETVDAARGIVADVNWPVAVAPVAPPIVDALCQRLDLLLDLGLGYLTLDRPSPSLAPGEVQRIRLASHALGAMSNVLYVLDEPSIGLHPTEVHRLLRLLRRLLAGGNSVVVVEHNPAVIAAADHVIELGPGAGPKGGRVVSQGPPRRAASPLPPSHAVNADHPEMSLHGARLHTLRGDTARFKLGTLNALCGPSGAGKKSLLMGCLVPLLGENPPGDTALGQVQMPAGGPAGRVHVVDNSPIGRTPRSNAATYTGLWDEIRKLYARQPPAQSAGYSASHFSFNTGGGRCDHCEGAGVQQVGLFFLGAVSVPCPACQGRRFDPATLAVTWRGLSVADILAMSVDEALPLFADMPKIAGILEALAHIGLGYVALGQPSTTLSGGEAQRVKLATHLANPPRKPTFFVLLEPTTGLHESDVARLQSVLGRIVQLGHTVIAVEHDLQFLAGADWLVEFGPGSGAHGGAIVAQGTPASLATSGRTATGRCLAGGLPEDAGVLAPPPSPAEGPRLWDVRTHNLKGIDVTFPARQLTVVTGPSGSGKSSLAFDTLYAESQRRFVQGLSAHARQYLQRLPAPRFAAASGLTPAVAIDQRSISANPRSTVATVTDIMDHLRLLYSRLGHPQGFTAGQFSFNREEGACQRCGGMGFTLSADPDKLITHASRSLLDGAMNGHKTGRFYGDGENRFVHVLRAVGEALGHDFSTPWQALPPAAQHIAMFGTGDATYQATWDFQRKGHVGSHTWSANWPGLVHYVNEEYQRKHADKRGDALVPLLREERCPECLGERLASGPREVRFQDVRLPELLAWPVSRAAAFLTDTRPAASAPTRTVWDLVVTPICHRLDTLAGLGLGYLALNRRTPSLSGGEATRVRLATQLGGRLHGVTYVLDEPTVGLHPHDTTTLLATLRRLRDEGNAVVVVEHDQQLIDAADWVVELGPGGGSRGGELLHMAPPGAGPVLAANGPPPAPEDQPGPVIRGADAQNLKGIDVTFRGQALNVVTGLSGAGKSTLLFEVLEPSLIADRPVGCRGFERGGIDDVCRIDASPIGKSPFSTPATLLGLLDPLRKLYAATEAARTAGLTSAHFTYASPKGRCPQCKGSGHQQVAMDFMADVWVPCEGCGGQRYAPEPLAILWQGYTVAQLLKLTVCEAREVLSSVTSLVDRLALLEDLGLGYLPLCQPATALSGGESQRLKLAAELLRHKGAGSTLYLLDEPTRGLADSDVNSLLQVLGRLTRAGNTVIAVEHNLHFIDASHHVIDLGPGAGDAGGRIVATGSPRELARAGTSATSRALRAYTARRSFPLHRPTLVS